MDPKSKCANLIPIILLRTYSGGMYRLRTASSAWLSPGRRGRGADPTPASDRPLCDLRPSATRAPSTWRCSRSPACIPTCTATGCTGQAHPPPSSTGCSLPWVERVVAGRGTVRSDPPMEVVLADPLKPGIMIKASLRREGSRGGPGPRPGPSSSRAGAWRNRRRRGSAGCSPATSRRSRRAPARRCSGRPPRP